MNSGFLAHQLPDFLGQLWLGKNRRIGVFRLAEASTPGDVVLVNQLKRGELPSHYILIGRDHQGEANYYLDTHQRDAAGECPIVVFRDGRPDPIGVAENFAALLINARKATA